LKKAGLEDLAKDARELILMIQMFGNFPSFIITWKNFYLNFLPKAFGKINLPQTLEIIKRGDLKENKSKDVLSLTQGQIRRWLVLGLPLKEAEILDTINMLRNEPLSISELLDRSLNQASSGAQVVYRYLLRYVGCFVHKEIVADNPEMGSHYEWCERDDVWRCFFRR